MNGIRPAIHHSPGGHQSPGHSLKPPDFDNTYNEDRLLSRIEVERQFGISKRFLEVAGRKESGPPYVQIGRSIRYRIKDIRDWIKSQIIQPCAQ